MRVLVTYCSDEALPILEYTPGDFTLNQRFAAHLEYPRDRAIIDQLLAHFPDKWLKVYVEATKPLLYEKHIIEGITYYNFEVPLVRRNALKRYESLTTPEEGRADVVTELRTITPYRYTLSKALEEALGRCWLTRTGVAHDYVYHEPYLALLDAFRQLYRTIVCKYPRCRLPCLINNDTLARTRLAETLIHECLHLSEFERRRTDQNEARLNTFAVKGSVDPQLLRQSVKSKGVHLSHNCCLGLWPSIERARLQRVYTVTDLDGAGFRNEGGAANGRERLESFRRIQSVFIGTQAEVELEAQQIEAGLSKFLDTLGLEYRILRVTPWYGNLDDKKTLDWEVGVHNDALTYIEVANLTRAGTIFTKNYDVRTIGRGRGVYALSGCSGLGLERLALIYLAKHGFDPDRWPDAVKSIFCRIQKSL